MLLGVPRERNAKLTCFAIQIGTLDAKGLGGVGHAPAVVFQNGRKIEGRWSRPSINSRTIFKTNGGKPIPMMPGGEWVILVATNAPLYA